MSDKLLNLEFIPCSFGMPEYGSECVVKINGSIGTAVWDYSDKWINDNYDDFDSFDVTEWISIVDIFQAVPTMKII